MPFSSDKFAQIQDLCREIFEGGMDEVVREKCG